MALGLLDPLTATSYLDWRGVVVAFVWKQTPFVALMVGRMLELPFLRYFAQFVPPLLACVAMAGAVFLVKAWAGTDGPSSLAWQIVLGALAYAVTLFLVAGRKLQGLRATLRKR